jgi:hypothetical protein
MLNAGGTEITIPRTAENRSASRRNPHFGIGSHPAYMMNGGDLYELAKILGHSNIKMTERYAKLAKQHIARTGATAGKMWKLALVDKALRLLSEAGDGGREAKPSGNPKSS